MIRKNIVLWILLVVACLSLIPSIIWYNWQYPKEYEYALRLADDASLPEVKAEYLKEYLNKIKEIKGQPAYIFMRPDLELSKQISILEGLIKRFEDISKISPSEMAYQQGMQQLSGQEIDHQLERISGIFQSAKLREGFTFFIIIILPLFLWSIWAIIGVIRFIISELD